MLLPWSKPIVISIAPHSASIRVSKRRTELVSDIKNPSDSASLISAFTHYRSQLKNTRVQFVISNHFMRYLILPWSPGVTARADWLALAEQAMRAEYGNAAADWILRVNLLEHGESVIAAAMDRQLYHAIFEFANHFKCKVSVIEPLLMAISRKHQSHNSFMITEPGRLLFCELSQGKIKQFIAASPPDMQSIGHATQIISRHFLLNNSHKTPVVNYLSSVLANQTDDSLQHDSDEEKLIYLNKHAGSHSCWLAGL